MNETTRKNGPIREQEPVPTESDALAERMGRLEATNRELRDGLAQLREENTALKEKALSLAQANHHLATAKKRLQRLALYDTQTGLGNRDLFLRQLEHVMAIAERRSEEVALLEMDLDGFKTINDRLGHAAGDEVLREIGIRLREALRQADQKFRIGGDEFAVLLEPRAGAYDGAVIVAEQLAAKLIEPIEIRGHVCEIGISIGIAVFPQHGREANALLRRADAAMYEAKKTHRVVAGASDAGATTVLKRLEPELLQIIYVSTAVRPMSTGDLVSLLLKARIRNERMGITGMLLYREGRFIEVLEGEKANVERIFADIEQDGRHKSVDVLRSEPVPFRSFPNWSMGFEGFDSTSVPAFSGFLEQDARPDYFDEESVEAHAILLAFKNSALNDPVAKTPAADVSEMLHSQS